MRLLQPGKSPSESDTRIQIGSVVEYEQHAVPLLAIVTAEKKGKWVVHNEAGGQLELPADRLYLLPGRPVEAADAAERTKALVGLLARARTAQQRIDLGELWELLIEEGRELGLRELTELALSENTAEHHVAMRRALIADPIFFKRKKNSFEPRPSEVVEELKVKARVEAEKEASREGLINAVVRRLKDGVTPLPGQIAILERYAALGKSAEDSKEAQSLVDEIVKRANVSLSDRSMDRVFELLVRANHFTIDQNMTLIRLGRAAEFSEPVLDDARTVEQRLAAQLEGRHDLTQLFTVTIDNEGTRDFDDALSFERLPDGVRVGIFIADVAAAIDRDSPLESEAFSRSTSIYCPDAHIPMLPPLLSEDALSLVEGVKRPVMAFFVEFDEQLQVRSREICRATISVHKRLSYNEADALMCDSSDAGSEQLRSLLLGLWDIVGEIEARRLDAGAIQFSRREMTPKIGEDGRVVLEEANEDTPAHKLVSELMILANESAALYAREKGMALVFRSQEPPEVALEAQGLDIVEGQAREFFRRSFLKRSVTGTEPLPHFGLGLRAYAQLTSPIRRAADLINQRQIASMVETGEPFYSRDEVSTLIARLENGLDEAMLVQRERNRYFLLKYLIENGIRELDATILKVEGPKPLAEVEVIFSIAPFVPLGDKRDVQQLRKRLGSRIRLAIDAIDARRDQFSLREIAAEA